MSNTKTILPLSSTSVRILMNNLIEYEFCSANQDAQEQKMNIQFIDVKEKRLQQGVDMVK